ncbi:Transmembrane domain-containing protein [Spironucleus salmonicida]|uniref:Transmembrane domain-containing protein n=1 Tax=Spironucleus salmonicida TaxID=348837 RepID=A0A9P8LPN9_9EUKA|nr:Transmembrane domain-containing protein [Spironucleus salmonicida]
MADCIPLHYIFQLLLYNKAILKMSKINESKRNNSFEGSYYQSYKEGEFLNQQQIDAFQFPFTVGRLSFLIQVIHQFIMISALIGMQIFLNSNLRTADFELYSHFYTQSRVLILHKFFHILAYFVIFYDNKSYHAKFVVVLSLWFQMIVIAIYLLFSEPYADYGLIRNFLKMDQFVNCCKLVFLTVTKLNMSVNYEERNEDNYQ